MSYCTQLQHYAGYILKEKLAVQCLDPLQYTLQLQMDHTSLNAKVICLC